MKDHGYHTKLAEDTGQLIQVIKESGIDIDIAGIVDLTTLTGMPLGIPPAAASFLDHYPYAIVMGAQFNGMSPDPGCL